jgi:hypothetical protein
MILKRKWQDILANKEDIDGLQVKCVEIWHGFSAFFASMHARIKLPKAISPEFDRTWQDRNIP